MLGSLGSPHSAIHSPGYFDLLTVKHQKIHNNILTLTIDYWLLTIDYWLLIAINEHVFNTAS